MSLSGTPNNRRVTRRRASAVNGRALKVKARRWILAGITAGLGIVGAALTAFFTDQAKDWINEVVGITEGLACQYSEPVADADHERPVILLARFADDPNDEMWQRIIKVLYDEIGFDVIPGCTRFEITSHAGINEARTQFLKQMIPEMRNTGADMLIFGTVYSPGKVKVWSANNLGGCDWQKSEAVDLNDPSASDSVFTLTRSALYRVIFEGLTAACDRPQEADWSIVARKIDMAENYIENRKTVFTPKDYDDALMHIHAIGLSRYSNTGEDLWFERSKRAAEAIIARASAAKEEDTVAIFKGQLGWLYWIEFQNTQSREALVQSIGYFRDVQKASKPQWGNLLSSNREVVLGAFEEALRAGLSSVTPDEVEDVRQAR
jgi:hypothetical protein